MACVLASHPAEGEPRRIQPLRDRSTVAPLTLKYGQQPPRVDASPKVQARTVVLSWPEDREPRLQFNNQQPERRYVVAQTLKYGQQPSVSGALSVTEVAISRLTWEPPFQYPQRLPSSAIYFVAPVVNNPPIAGSFSTAIARMGWDAPFQFMVRPPSAAVYFVPATVDNPPLEAGLSAAVMSALRRAWQDPVMISLTLPGVIRVGGDATTPWSPSQTILRPSWEPVFQYPQRLPSAAVFFVAPVVDNPPPNGSITPTELALVRLAWEPPFVYPESEASNAGWNVPPLVASPYLARNSFPRWIDSSWRVPDGDIQFTGGFTPDTLGDQPPVAGALTPLEVSILRLASEPVRVEPPRSKVAPLIGTFGDQPVPSGPLAVSIANFYVLSIAAAWWPAQSEPENASWNFVPPVINQPTPVSPQLHIARMSWEPLFIYPESEANSAGWNVPAVVSQPTPLLIEPHIVRLSWEPPFVYPESEANSAAWNVPPVVNNPAPRVFKPHIARLAWEPYLAPTQRTRWIAPFSVSSISIIGAITVVSPRMVLSVPAARVILAVPLARVILSAPEIRVIITEVKAT